MSEYDIFKVHPRMPKKVKLADITVRDGFQHEEIWIPTEAKIFYLQELAFAGVKRMEATNLGNPRIMPQFKDAEAVLEGVRSDIFQKRLQKRGIDPDSIQWAAVTIREPAVDRAIRLKEEGRGPDRVLMMVSTDEQHHFANSGTTLPEYWKEAERCIKKCKDAGLEMCGTVSTIWGSPISGPTRLEDAVEFTKRWLSIGADDIEHADHDGSAPPDQVYRYFSMILDELPNPELHLAHFHVTRGWGLANVLAALQAGIIKFEGTLGGTGGQPANFLDRTPVPGTGSYYYKDPNIVGLVSFEDMCVMLDEMGIDIGGIDVDRILELGGLMERTLGRRLRSESMLSGRIPKEPREDFKRPRLAQLKEKLGEKPGQIIPEGWPEKAEVPPEISGKQ
ncbi:MAG: pyruvate carboxyltransferase [Deltaproteobacteria bacterium]|nr:pyruvate carboxyltransferase [Deltaproteobacteria bacterium]MBW1924125.1 pyruvate carboxyltransferase [Deltaproteobacteria bacterium]MBW1949334.1 pyruvate carboxyltransferase [Deltaproteobacteria bacterium]MBW2008878.1 pyruvate carboxyltransferase [Deltaproteobacteria bacterium]MBW2102944.1 pyruvate carboxyltransferase [Deltaproteobacteria bacterium]